MGLEWVAVGDASLGPMLKVPAVQGEHRLENLTWDPVWWKWLCGWHWKPKPILFAIWFRWVPAVPELLRVSPASLLLSVRDILGPVLFPLYPKCLLENLSSAAAIFLPAAHFRHRTRYWLELINISMVLLPNVELSAVVATWQLVIYILEG